MFKQKETKTIRALLEQHEQLVQDEYSNGVYNGIELALSVLEKREPKFQYLPKEPKVIEKELKTDRTVGCGIIRRGEQRENN